MFVRVKVTPSAKKEVVTKVSETEFEMSVKEPAERNLANARVRELLGEAYGLRAKDVRIVSGHHSGVKMFDVAITK